MNQTESVLPLLNHLGIQAYIQPDAIYGTLIMLDTQAYDEHRRQIDAWFTFVRQIGRHSYFQVRYRGTGDTR